MELQIEKLRTEELRNLVSGGVWRPGEDGYAEASGGGFNRAVVHNPELIVEVGSAEDAREAVRFASGNGLRIAVQSTGHGTHHPVTSGMLMLTRKLDGVSIDAAGERATIGAGAQWGEVVSAAAEYGLLPITGSSPTVGVAGYLLGGGMGPLVRSHGYSSDYVEEVKLVTGGGEIVTANREERPDLFWALRGGKHGFGLVTEVTVRLAELSTLYGGFLMFAEEDIETVFRSWIDWTATADPRVSTSVAIIGFPPVAAIPEQFRGKKMIGLRFAYPGPADEGMRFAAPLRAFGQAVMDTISEMPASEMARIHNDPVDPIPSQVGGRLLSHLDQNGVSRILSKVGAGVRPPIMVTEIRHLGGASHIDVPEGSAAGGRAARFTFSWVATNPMQFASEVPEFAGRLYDELAPWIASEGNINFMGTPASNRDYASAWSPESFAALEVIRSESDPQRLFAHTR